MDKLLNSFFASKKSNNNNNSSSNNNNNNVNQKADSSKKYNYSVFMHAVDELGQRFRGTALPFSSDYLHSIALLSFLVIIHCSFAFLLFLIVNRGTDYQRGQRTL